MKILHILRSEPNALVRLLMAKMVGGYSKEFPLYRGSPDYDQLVKEIFESDKVICWW